MYYEINEELCKRGHEQNHLITDYKPGSIRFAPARFHTHALPFFQVNRRFKKIITESIVGFMPYKYNVRHNLKSPFFYTSQIRNSHQAGSWCKSVCPCTFPHALKCRIFQYFSAHTPRTAMSIQSLSGNHHT